MKRETIDALYSAVRAYCNLFLKPSHNVQNPEAYRLSHYIVMVNEVWSQPHFKALFLRTSKKAETIKSSLLTYVDAEWYSWSERAILDKLFEMKEDILKFINVGMPGKVIELTSNVIKQINEVETIVREDFEDKGWCSCQIS
jgi:hypothetical protein